MIMMIKRYEGDFSLTEIFLALVLVVYLCVRAYRTVLESPVRECVRVEFMVLKG